MSNNKILRLPNFIGVGPPRTATTWLHEALAGHVGLPAGVKETDFFVYKYEKGLEWYAAHFATCSPDGPIGEFSPNYFTGAQARERIARDIPSCKILVTLRDPVQRTYSHYRKMREGEYFSGSFEACLEKRPDILEWSKYATHVNAWRQLFGVRNVMVLFQEDLKASPQTFLNQATDFVEVSRIQLVEPDARDKLVNAIPTLPRNPRLAKLARYTRERLQKNGHYGFVNLAKKIGLRNLLFSGGATFEPIHPDTDAHLRKFFQSEIEALEKMLDRDLSNWKLDAHSRARVSD